MAEEHAYRHEARMLSLSDGERSANLIPWYEHVTHNGYAFELREGHEPKTLEVMGGKQVRFRGFSFTPKGGALLGDYKGAAADATLKRTTEHLRMFTQVLVAKSLTHDKGNLITQWTGIQFRITERFWLGADQDAVREFHHHLGTKVNIGPSARIMLRKGTYLYLWPRYNAGFRGEINRFSAMYGLEYEF